MKTTITMEFTSKRAHDSFMVDFLGLMLKQKHTPGLKISTRREYQLDDELAGAPPQQIVSQLERLLRTLGVEDDDEDGVPSSAGRTMTVSTRETPLEEYINSLDATRPPEPSSSNQD